MNRTMKRWAAPVLAALLVGVTACETATPYQPLTRGNAVFGGYSDRQIEADRFRVSFAGNTMTSRQTVENYLLYRAAQLTVERGFDWFQMVDRNTRRRSNTYVDRTFNPGPYGYWGPAWRFRGRGFGWRSWDPFWGDPFWGDSINITTVDRYEATAEIVTRRGPKPADNVRAFDARAVMANLGPSIEMPR